ncbi:rho-related BTB domain-containing protein 1 [Trichonephila clavipes]|nr:rho-related BTB domain-containing protein 1 [Trichonephila clavipes]
MVWSAIDYNTRIIQESDLITREQGRQLANEIGAFYYESSVLTQYGVDAVFENAVRLALIARRQQRFWVKSLRNVTSPLLQIPYRPPKPREPETKVLPSTFEEDMYSLLDKEYETDVNLMVGKSRIHSHKIILTAASSHFKQIFISSSLENSRGVTLPTFVRLSPSSVQCFLRFLYTGDLSIITNDIVDDLKIAATFTDIAELKVLMNNIEKNNLDEKHALRDTFYKKLVSNLKKVCLNEQLFVDVTFELDDGKCYAHRSLLMARCAVMKAMFGGEFRESTAQIIPFPGVTKEAFDIFLYYLYTDSIDESLSVENCLPVIELANRLCLPRLISVAELHIVQKLSTMKAKGISLNEQVFKLLEPCQVHNADQLAEWCQYYIIIHYQDISLNVPKLIPSLHPDNQAYLNKNRWPPAHSHVPEIGPGIESCIRGLVSLKIRSVEELIQVKFVETETHMLVGWGNLASRMPLDKGSKLQVARQLVRLTVPNLVHAALGPEQMFRSGGQPEAKPSVFSSQARACVISKKRWAETLVEAILADKLLRGGMRIELRLAGWFIRKISAGVPRCVHCAPVASEIVGTKGNVASFRGVGQPRKRSSLVDRRILRQTVEIAQATSVNLKHIQGIFARKPLHDD